MQKPKKKAPATSKHKAPRKRAGSDKVPRREGRKDQSKEIANKASAPKSEGTRINRYLASCGLCSRREADRWIEEGRVSLNGKKITQPGVKIGEHDLVEVDGKAVVPAANQTYIIYNKPRGLLCTRKDAKGRPLIYDKLDIPANVQSIGRLDMDSEGLLLLTDNGELAQNLMHPGAKIPRQYRVRITSQLSIESMEALRNGGIDMGEGDISDPWELTMDSETKGHSWITVTIHRGRNREVRRTLEACGHEVRRLMRIRFGPINLDLEMSPGAWRTLKAVEVKKLKGAAVTRKIRKE
ncbi:MAG: pseudouridine synthase [Mariprofundaceae bacterium]